MEIAYNKKRKFSINYIKKSKFLIAEVYGEEDNLQISREYWNEVLTECAESDFNKLLVLEKFENDVNTSDTFVLSTEIAKLTTEKNIKVAFIDKETTHDEMNKFGEVVAVNRGANIKVFNSIEDAEKWLIK